MGKEKIKPSGALKAYLSAGNNGRVVGAVDRYLLSRPAGDRSTTVIHPSEMASSSWCHRAQYFWLKGETPKHEPIGLKKAITFSTGHAIHATWQNWFGEMGNLYGLWECNETGEKVWDVSSNLPKEKSWVYRELPLKSEEYRISGHADGWLKNFGDDLLLEIKSIGEGSIRWYAPHIAYQYATFSEMWNAVSAPFHEHIQQVQIYLKLVELMGLPNPPQEALILYEAKATHEVKEFVIKKRDFGVDELFLTAKRIVSAVDSGVAPLCNIGGVSGCKKCSHYTEENADGQISD
jgi:hypothetical protein